jgi:hypothetical protein
VARFVSTVRARARAESKELAALFRLSERGNGKDLPARADRISALLTSSDHSVRVQAERLLLEQEFGKPRQRLEHAGELRHRAVFEDRPPDETREQWLERMGIAQAKLEELGDEVAN